MDERTLAWIEMLARALLWAAVAVIGLTVVAAIIRMMVADRRQWTRE